MSYAKVITLRVSIGAEDERDIDTFVKDLKSVIEPISKEGAATVLGSYYVIDGQPIRPDGAHFITGEKAEEASPKKKTSKKAPKERKEEPKAEAVEAIPEPEPEPVEPDNNSKDKEVRDLASKVSGNIKPGRVSMRKNS
jgi:hypothetical protein